MSQVKIDVKICDQARKVVEQALEAPLAELGLKIQMKVWNYNVDEIRVPSFKLKPIDADPDEVLALRQELKDRKRYNWMIELDGDRVVEIRSRGGIEKVKLWGFKPKGRKTPFMAKRLEDLNDNDSSYFPMGVEKVEQLWGEKDG